MLTFTQQYRKEELKSMTDEELEIELALVQAEIDMRIDAMKRNLFDINRLKV